MLFNKHDVFNPMFTQNVKIPAISEIAYLINIYREMTDCFLSSYVYTVLSALRPEVATEHNKSRVKMIHK